MYENIIEMTMLYDFYGELLTEKQKSIMQMFHEEDYTQSEVADRLGISRQAVHDAVKNCEKTLYEFEEKLGLVNKFAQTGKALAANDSALEVLIQNASIDGSVIRKLLEIQRRNKEVIKLIEM